MKKGDKVLVGIDGDEPKTFSRISTSSDADHESGYPYIMTDGTKWSSCTPDMKMKVIILNYSNGSVTVTDIGDEEDIWNLGFRPSETEWMEIKDIDVVQEAIDRYETN